MQVNENYVGLATGGCDEVKYFTKYSLVLLLLPLYLLTKIQRVVISHTLRLGRFVVALTPVTTGQSQN